MSNGFPKQRRFTLKRAILLGLLVVPLCAVGLGWYFLPDLVDSRARAVLDRGGKLLGVTIDVERAHLSGLSTLVLEGLTVHVDGAGPEEIPLATVSRITVDIAASSLLSGKPRLERVVVHEPELTAIRRPDGTLNITVIQTKLGRLLSGEPGVGGSSDSGIWSLIAHHIPVVTIDGGALALRDQTPDRPEFVPAELDFMKLSGRLENESVRSDDIKLKASLVAELAGFGGQLKGTAVFDQETARGSGSLVLRGPFTVPLGPHSMTVGRVSWYGNSEIILSDIEVPDRVTVREVAAKLRGPDATGSVSSRIASIRITEPVVKLPQAIDLTEIFGAAFKPVVMANMPAADTSPNPPLGKRPAIRKKGAEVREMVVGVYSKVSGKVQRGARKLVSLTKRFPLPEITIERGRVQSEGTSEGLELSNFGIHMKRTGEVVDLKLTVSDNPVERIDARIALDSGQIDLSIVGALPLAPLRGVIPKFVALNPGARLAATDLKFTYTRSPAKLSVKGKWGVDGIRLALPWLAAKPLALSGLTGAVDATLDMADDALTVDSGHVAVGPGRLNYSFGVRDFTASPVFSWTLEIPRTHGQAVVDAIPTAILGTLRDLKLKGDFSWKNTGRLDTRDMRTFDYKSTAKTHGFGVVDLGKRLDFSVLRKPFVHRVQEGGGKIVEFTTGPKSKRWVSYGRVSPWMAKVLTTTEDGTFWRHKGLAFFAFKEAMVANLERGRFYRGGSTITQQLVKNIFLIREKTIARKLQEMFIAWRMEHFFSKKQLLALYLNIVELGPNLYGIGKASWHYFGKRPSELDVVECAFIASLLPSPRRYYYQYKRGRVTEGWRKGLKKTLEVMHKRGKLTEDELHMAAPYSPDFRR
ncbi:MAG: hypothetical protein ACI9OJ_000504 [Myxococcota bacterium]